MSSAQTQLPIDVVPDSRPLTFRWKQVVHTPWGCAVQDCEGPLPPSCEQAVADLVVLVKSLSIQVGNLAEQLMVAKGSIQMAVDRLGGLVEGKPTHGGNFLQRIDELVAIEAEQAESSGEEVPMPTSTDKSKKGLR